MTLAEKIMAIYPEITQDDFIPMFNKIILVDESNGQPAYIATWNMPEPEPTQEQLDAYN